MHAHFFNEEEGCRHWVSKVWSGSWTQKKGGSLLHLKAGDALAAKCWTILDTPLVCFWHLPLHKLLEKLPPECKFMIFYCIRKVFECFFNLEKKYYRLLSVFVCVHHL